MPHRPDLPPEDPGTTAFPPSSPPLTPPARPTPLPAGTALIVGVLLAIPLIGLAAVPLYSRTTPKLLGFPFFYWYQLAWVIVTPVLTYAAFLLIQRARGRR